jgi:hypothetical protein
VKKAAKGVAFPALGVQPELPADFLIRSAFLNVPLVGGMSMDFPLRKSAMVRIWSLG